MKEDWSYWKMGLPAHSQALADLDELCTITGLQRAEVSRLIILTWSAARRGKQRRPYTTSSSSALGKGG